MKEILTSSATGKLSIKRTAGLTILLIGVAIKVYGCIAAIEHLFADPGLFETCSNSLIYTGAGLLGFGVLDGIGKTKGGS
jgi:hypothetical protein